uniref:G-protein coupled receptors family 1 profile domain-containing protein n=1 Tax=Hucho hucho TaxID=62062 RepID=A0A4W5MQ78_9TELE
GLLRAMLCVCVCVRIFLCDDIIDPGLAPPPPLGCGVNVDPLFRTLCDLESVWGVVLEAVACGGAITSLVLSVVLLAKRHSILDPDRRSGLGPLLLLPCVWSAGSSGAPCSPCASPASWPRQCG